MGECLLDSESEESLSGLEFDNDSGLDDCALHDVVVDGDSDEGVTEDCTIIRD
jgi:hypothetical protein